ncbi:MAG: CRISPR-associated protein Csx19 [Caldilineaceae bacterium]
MRTLVNCGFNAKEVNVDSFQSDPAAWFAQQESLGDDTWLLAYAEDGAIWGKLSKGTLALAPANSPMLSANTLLEARLFGAQGEVHIWRTNEGFNAYRITDVPEENGAFDETQRLWGTESEGAADGFTHLVDGQEELRHTMPIEIPRNFFTKRHPRFHPALIQTRHYFAINQETGVTSIALSRLVSVQSESLEEYRERVKNYE